MTQPSIKILPVKFKKGVRPPPPAPRPSSTQQSHWSSRLVVTSSCTDVLWLRQEVASFGLYIFKPNPTNLPQTPCASKYTGGSQASARARLHIRSPKYAPVLRRGHSLLNCAFVCCWAIWFPAACQVAWPSLMSYLLPPRLQQNEFILRLEL